MIVDLQKNPFLAFNLSMEEIIERINKESKNEDKKFLYDSIKDYLILKTYQDLKNLLLFYKQIDFFDEDVFGKIISKKRFPISKKELSELVSLIPENQRQWTLDTVKKNFDSTCKKLKIQTKEYEPINQILNQVQALLDKEINRLENRPDKKVRIDALFSLKILVNQYKNGIKVHSTRPSQSTSASDYLAKIHQGFRARIRENLPDLDKHHRKWYNKLGITLLNILWGAANIPLLGMPGVLKQHFGTNQSFFFSLHGKSYEAAKQVENEFAKNVFKVF